MTASSLRAAHEIADAAVASFAACPDDRLRDLMESLVTHLHAFAREVGLTPEEWARAMKTLAEAGRMTDEHRQEFILWSDTLGLSMAVDALAADRDPRATESTVEGPFRAPGAPSRAFGDSIAERAGGVPLLMHGRILDVDDNPIANAEIDVWQNGPDRLYAVQDPSAPHDHLRGTFSARGDGTYAILALRPTPYSIPDDGPVGAMLRATKRRSWRPAHVHVAVSAPGFRELVTHIFDGESDFLDDDAVFAVKPSLVKTFAQRAATDPARPAGVNEPWCSVDVDFVLERAQQTVPTTTPSPRWPGAGP